MGACLASLKFCITPEFSSRGLRFKSKRRRHPRFGDPGFKLRTPDEVHREEGPEKKMRNPKEDSKSLLDKQSARITNTSIPSKNERIVNVDPVRIHPETICKFLLFCVVVTYFESC